MSGRLHPEDRRELFWALPLALAACGGLLYVTRQFVFDHWFTVSERLWDNPEGIGFLWGFLGFSVLLGYFLFFWTGMFQHVARVTKIVGLIVTIALSAVVAFGAFSFYVQIRRVWIDDAQRLGWILGSVWVWVLIGSWKLIGMWIFGRRLNPLHGRFNSNQHRELAAVETKLYDGGKDLPAKDAAVQ
jgi:hypothetical protein